MRKAAMLRSSLDCIMTFDLDGRITEFNPAAERAFGYTAQEAMGREMSELIIPRPCAKAIGAARALQCDDGWVDAGGALS